MKGSGFLPEDLHTRLHDRVRRAIIHEPLRLGGMMEDAYRDRCGI